LFVVVCVASAAVSRARLNEDLQKMARWLGLERVKAPR